MTGTICRPIAVIPARGGSKRIPRKNVREFAGQPMIAWPIQAALSSGCFDRVIVSTDDDEVARVSRSFGADVPFRRPAELSDDHATTSAVMAHAMDWASSHGLQPSAACCIYATAPMLDESELAEGLRLIGDPRWRFVFSATRFEAPVQRGFELLPGGGLQMLWPDKFAVRSQDLPAVYHDAAQFYWGLPNAWRAQERIFGRTSTFVEIPRWRSVDIDTEEDWVRAELLFRAVRESRHRSQRAP
jgi:pseudaminic acid cytidylyltransferase